MPPSVNITVVTCNRIDLTRICLGSMLPTITQGVRVTIVDNGSTDGTREYLDSVAENHAGVSIVKLRRNMGVAVAANLGWASMDADYYLKLDNDIEICRRDWLEKLLAFCERNPQIGMAAYRFCDWHRITPEVLPSGDLFHRADCSNGACVLIPRKVHETCGFWNEDYGRYGFTDVDYSNRAVLQGWRIGYLPEEDAARHLGYAEGAVSEPHEQLKQATITSKLAGERLYLLNKFLFEEGIRSCRVERKYLPDPKEGTARFILNESYRPIMKLQAELQEKIDYTQDGDAIKLDLSRFKKS